MTKYSAEHWKWFQPWFLTHDSLNSNGQQLWEYCSAICLWHTLHNYSSKQFFAIKNIPYFSLYLYENSLFIPSALLLSKCFQIANFCFFWVFWITLYLYQNATNLKMYLIFSFYIFSCLRLNTWKWNFLRLYKLSEKVFYDAHIATWNISVNIKNLKKILT